jgi:hypothetical protein
MEFLAQQINPPASWETFEELCRALFAAIWNDPLAQRNGRSGQAQHGVDIHGARPEHPGETLGVQCKGKDRNFGKKATTREFDVELAKAEGFVPTLAAWTFATTFADDAKLQAHALAVSRQCIAAGKFPVNALGWNSLVSQLAQHPKVIEQFYPGLGVQLPQLMATLAALPDRVIGALGTAPPDQAQEAWIEERFDQARDLGPALLGRPLGAADVSACPELPQVDRLWRELDAGFSARLVATAGAGKSVCALQLAKRAHDKGWRVLRLKDSEVGALALAPGDQPTLHIIDDAHLTDPQLLRRAEEAAGATQWLLSAHTIADDKAPLPGAIRIDPAQAVAVIAAGLRADLPATARIVKRIDDRIGDAIGDEAIEDRLAAAATAQRPWQFCFILGGGWRRAQQSAEDARAADADLVLAAAAIRQLATRDARAQPDDLTGLFDAGGIAAQQRHRATTWLIERRLLLAEGDLRCPHQRLASVLIAQVLEGQTKEGRAAMGAMVDHVIAAGTYPLSGISALLTELRMMGNFPTRWTYLVDRSRLPALIARCWGAESPEARRGAAWLLSELQSYVDDWAATITQGYMQVAADWFSAPLPGTGYGIGHLIGQIGMKDAALAQGVIALADPVRVAAAVSQGDTVLACEAAGMVSSCMRHRPDSWRIRYLAAIDRDACLATMRSWPRDHYLSAAGSFCELFTWDDEAFGLDLIEALLPAIGEEVRARPFHSFHELHDMVWHALRMSDTLGIYAGEMGPWARMRAVAAQLAACWTPEELAAQVSAINRRDFQTAAWLLGFIGEVSKRQFEATVARIDWLRIDRKIGDAWGAMYHEVAIFLQVAFQAASAKASIRAMIAAHLDEMEPLSVRLAMLAPETAARQVIAGKSVGLSTHDHFHWRMSAAVVAQLVNPHPDLLEPMIAPHVAVASAQLGRKTQPFFDKPLLFLRFARQMAPVGFERIMAGIDPDGAEAGWTAALQGADAKQHAPTGDRRQRRADRESAAWLVEHALERDDALGEVARRVRARFPRRSLPPAKLLEPFT